MTLQEILADIKSPRKKKVILDTDTFNEVDDQFAVAYAYLSDKIDLLAVNAAPFHNEKCSSFAEGMELSYQEIHKILALTDPDYKTPVFRGSCERITDTKTYVESPACDNIIKTVHESDEPIYVVAIGCCTNIASAIMKDPSIMENMIFVWLGANELKMDHSHEFNLSQDVRAGQIVVNNPDLKLLLCPAWCVTGSLTANIEMIYDLKGHNALCDYLAANVEECYEQAGRPEGWLRIIWDIGLPAVMDIPECATIKTITSPVLTDDLRHGIDSTRHEILYLDALNKDMIFERTWSILKTANK